MNNFDNKIEYKNIYKNEAYFEDYKLINNSN